MRPRRIDALILILAVVTALPMLSRVLRRYPGVQWSGPRRSIQPLSRLTTLPPPRVRQTTRTWLPDHVTALALGSQEGRPVLWVGTFERGLVSIRTDTGAVRRIPGPTPSSGMVNDLAVAPDRLWAATAGGILEVRGSRAQRLGAAEGLPSEHVTALTLGPGGELWAGTSRGLAVRPPGATRFQPVEGPYDYPITSLAWEGGRLLVGSLRGLDVLEKGVWRRVQPGATSLPGTYVTALLPHPGGLWIGTYSHGLVRFESASPLGIDGRPSLPSGRVNPGALALVADRLCVGTDGDGLLLRTRRDWRRLGPEHGLPEGNVSAVAGRPLKVGIELWVGTRSGLARTVLEPEDT